MNGKETSQQAPGPAGGRHPVVPTVLRRCAPPPAGVFGHLSRVLAVLFSLAVLATGGALIWAGWSRASAGLGAAGIALAALGATLAWLSCTTPTDQICGAVRIAAETLTLPWW